MKALLLTLLGLQALSASDLQTVSDLSGPHVRYRCLIGVVGREEFARMAVQFLHPADVTLGVLAIYGSNWQRVVASPQDGGDTYGYEVSRMSVRTYDIQRNGCPEVQEAVKVRAGILLRWMDRDCRSGKRLLEGKTNPLEMTLDGEHIELLEFSFFNPGVGADRDSVDSVGLCVRTSGDPSVSHATSVLARLQELTGFRKLTMMLRSDPWFYNAGGFPALYPFDGPPKFPTIQEFERTREVFCATFGGGEPISCHEYPAGRARSSPGPAKRD
jgi:hypothetical protein